VESWTDRLPRRTSCGKPLGRVETARRQNLREGAKGNHSRLSVLFFSNGGKRTTRSNEPKPSPLLHQHQKPGTVSKGQKTGICLRRPGPKGQEREGPTGGGPFDRSLKKRGRTEGCTHFRMLRKKRLVTSTDVKPRGGQILVKAPGCAFHGSLGGLLRI